MQRRPVNERQAEVLRWIGAGSPDRDWSNESYKTTARALANRGLVNINRRTGLWSAAITDAGRHFLENGEYPAPVEARSSAGRGRELATTRRNLRSEGPTAPNEHAEGPGSGTAQPSPALNPDMRHAETVIEKVRAAGGQVDLGKVDFDTTRVLAAAIQASNRPRDRILRFAAYGGWTDRKQVAYFDDDLTLRVERQHIVVPERVAKHHPAAAAYKADPDQHMVSKDSLSRATRVLHALLTEATRRGHEVSSRRLTNLDASAFRAAIGKGQIEITVGDFAYGILVAEKAGKGGKRQDYRLRYPYDPPAREKPRWRQIRQNTFVPTGQLSITIVTAGSTRDGRPLIFNDGARRRLEERLGEVLWEIEVRALEDARNAHRAELAAAEKRRQWEEAMETAKLRLAESHRGQVLDRQVAAWETANRRRTYVAAMAAKVAAMPATKERELAQDWLDWCTNSIGPEDPLERKLKMPISPEPTAQNLEPFLDGWSPYGPDGYGRR